MPEGCSHLNPNTNGHPVPDTPHKNLSLWTSVTQTLLLRTELEIEKAEVWLGGDGERLPSHSSVLGLRHVKNSC